MSRYFRCFSDDPTPESGRSRRTGHGEPPAGRWTTGNGNRIDRVVVGLDRVGTLGLEGRFLGVLEFDVHGRVEQRAGESAAGVAALDVRVRW